MKVIIHEIPPPTPPKTYDLIGLSQEELDMLREFAYTAACTLGQHEEAAAKRFLDKTKDMAGTTYNPDICFK